MIVEYLENGFIHHIRSDPDGDEVLQSLLSQPRTIHVTSIPLPSVPVRDADGKLVIENGKVKRDSPGFTQPQVTHDFHMVKGGKVVERPTLPAGDVEIKADGKDTFTLDGLPRPCVIRVDGQEHEVKGGVLHFSTNDAGTYLFEAGFPFVDWSAKVIAK